MEVDNGSSRSDKGGGTRSLRKRISTSIKQSKRVGEKNSTLRSSISVLPSSRRYDTEQKSDSVEQPASNQNSRRPGRNVQQYRASMPAERSMASAMSEYEKKIRRKLEEMDNRQKPIHRTVYQKTSVEEVSRSSSTPEISFTRECGNNRPGQLESLPENRRTTYTLLDTRDTTFEERLARKLESAGGTKKQGHDNPVTQDGIFEERLARKLESSRRTRKQGHEKPATQGGTFEERLAHKLESAEGAKKEGHETPTTRDGTFEERLARKIESSGGTKKQEHETPVTQYGTFEERLARKLESVERKKKGGRKRHTMRGKLETAGATKKLGHEKPITQDGTFDERPARKSESFVGAKRGDRKKPITQDATSKYEKRLVRRLESVREGKKGGRKAPISEKKAEKVSSESKFKAKTQDTPSQPRIIKEASPRVSKLVRKEKNDSNLDLSWGQLDDELAAAADNSIIDSNHNNESIRQFRCASSERVLDSGPREEFQKRVLREEFQKRMLRRTMHKGSSFRGSCKFSQLAIAEAILENPENETEDSITGINTDSCKKLMRSCSSSNLCPGAWECSTCTHINEPVGLDPCIVCRVCSEPNITNNRHTTSEQVQPRNSRQRHQDMSKDDSEDLYASWSDLGGALAAAISLSVNNTEIPKNLPGRVCNDSGSWECKHCTYHNLDVAARFCGACGQQR